MPEAYLNVTNPEYASGTPEYLFSGLGEADSASLHCMFIYSKKKYKKSPSNYSAMSVCGLEKKVKEVLTLRNALF